jgi:hypothetical protein
MSIEIAKEEQVARNQVNVFKERMLKWNNPVEFVNNMYGSHPDDDREYFDHVFGKDSK